MSHLSSFCRSNSAEFGSLCWTFDPENQYLNPRLMRLLYNKWTLRFVLLTMLPLMALSWMPMLAVYLYLLITFVFVWFPFLFLIILSFNRDVRGFIVKSSEFWIKIMYAVAKGVLQLVIYHYVPAIRNRAPEYLGYTFCVAGIILEVFLMICVGGMDAIPQMQYKWKAILMGIIAVVYTVGTIKRQLLVPEERDFILHITGESAVSFQSLSANVDGMMAMFLWKQAIDVIRNKGRCISISYRPYLMWTKPMDGSKLFDLKQIPETSANCGTYLADVAMRRFAVNGDDNLNCIGSRK